MSDERGGITFARWIKIGSVLALCLGGVVAANTVQGAGELALKAEDPMLVFGGRSRRHGSRGHEEYSDDIFWAAAGQKVVVDYDAATLGPSNRAELSAGQWLAGPDLADVRIKGPSAGRIEATVAEGGLYRVELRIGRYSYQNMSGRIDVRWQLR